MVGTLRFTHPTKFHFFNLRPLHFPATGVHRVMDMTLVSAALAAQAGSVQMQVAATLLKKNADAEKSAVLTLLGAAQNSMSSLANVGPGIGGNLDVTA